MIDEKVEEKMKEHNEKLVELQQKLEQQQQAPAKRPITTKSVQEARNGAIKQANKGENDEDDGTPSNSRPSVKKVVGSKIFTGASKPRSDSKEGALQNKNEA
mmetsp:Transcript_19129/g.18260  ORF Transcript_19129/g.18260 Transcript_19129/m.18260 type:complete len:102 (-) Transcript_19129:2198-2503(-)